MQKRLTSNVFGENTIANECLVSPLELRGRAPRLPPPPPPSPPEEEKNFTHFCLARRYTSVMLNPATNSPSWAANCSPHDPKALSGFPGSYRGLMVGNPPEAGEACVKHGQEGMR